MNWEMLQPVLTEMLEDGKVSRKEAEKAQTMLAEMTGKLTGIEDRLSKLAAPSLQVDSAELKRFIHLELTRLKSEIDQQVPRSGQQKRFVLFSDNFSAQNFKIVFETVCKWIGILGGGFYLVYSLIHHWVE